MFVLNLKIKQKRKEMEKIEFEGEIYYLINNKFVDSSFCSVDKSTNEKLCELYYQNMDFGKMSKEQLLEFIKKTKENEQFALTKKACSVALEKFSADENFIKIVLPIQTSCLRSLGMPNLALDVAQKYTDLVPNCDSYALWISVAAACCDQKDFKGAITYLGLAKQKKRGHMFDEESEFSAVEERIKKALNLESL